MELTYHDKEIMEHLFYDARRSTRHLAKIVGIKQPSVHARIKKLEEHGFIRQYDSLIATHLLPFIHKMYYCSLKQEQIRQYISMPCCTGIQELFGLYTHQLFCFFRTSKEMTAFESTLPKQRVDQHITGSHRLGGNIFDVKRQPEKYAVREQQFKLDTLDVQIMQQMILGGARKTLIEIARALNTTTAIVKYRKKKLIENGYFLLFVAQPGQAFKSIKIAYHVFTLRENANIAALRGLPGCLIAYTGEKTITIIQLSLSFDDYLDQSNKLYRILEPNTVNLQSFIIDKPIILNRYSAQLFFDK
jgi:DNA-binding Lrp family transcriptional regulator